MCGRVTVDTFERDTQGTVADWCRWLPPACGAHALQWGPPGQATVQLDPGELHLSWHPLPPRRLGLASLPRLLVRYQFVGVTAAQRQAFMAHFDLCMQRGGG